MIFNSVFMWVRFCSPSGRVRLRSDGPAWALLLSGYATRAQWNAVVSSPHANVTLILPGLLYDGVFILRLTPWRLRFRP